MQSGLLISMAAAVVFLSVYYIAPWLARQFRMNGIRSVVTRRRMLILTYDDGPSTEVTPRLLDLLRARGVRASFFLLGGRAQQSPDIVDRIVREGHSVGCHADQHVNAWTSSPAAATADIEAGYRKLSRWIRAEAMFRPPHGKMTAVTYWWIRRRHIPVFWWTIDSGDTWQTLPAAGEIAERLRKEGGGIVLIHDVNRSAPRNEYVLEVTAALLDVAESESMHILPLTEVPV